MILSKPNDVLVWGHCPQHRFRVLFADVSESARVLAERHACGPTASVVLAQAVAAAAILSADIEDASETVSMRIESDGPIGGALVEAAGSGDLRGYTRRKVLADLDERTELCLADVLGTELHLQVVRAKGDGTTVSRAALVVRSGNLRKALARYYAKSLQIPTHVELWSVAFDGRLERAAAIAVQKLPDGDAKSFSLLKAPFDTGQVVARLSEDMSLDGARAALGLPCLLVDRTRQLAFGCRCSRARALAALVSLSPADLAELHSAGHGQRVSCHMCGAQYAFTAEEITDQSPPEQPQTGSK